MHFQSALYMAIVAIKLAGFALIPQELLVDAGSPDPHIP